VKDFAFPSSGDPDRDAEIAADFRRHDANLSEGLCPNECGPLEEDGDRYHTRRCPKCGFVQQTFRLA
jgi:hypothetical protein